MEAEHEKSGVSSPWPVACGESMLARQHLAETGGAGCDGEPGGKPSRLLQLGGLAESITNNHERKFESWSFKLVGGAGQGAGYQVERRFGTCNLRPSTYRNA